MTPNKNFSSADTNFSSKELLFLKGTDLKSLPLDSPREYLSDTIACETPWMESFCLKLNKADIPGENFLCAVMKQKSSANGENFTRSLKHGSLQTIRNKTNVFFSKLFKNYHGIWHKLNNNVTAMALWEMEKNKAEETLFSIKKELALISNTTVSAGACWSPFINFSRKDTFHNAIKALDHAAFYGSNNLTFFDAVSLNISGDRLYQLGRIKKAAEEYNKGLKIDKNDTNLLNSQGVCFGMMNNLDMAQTAFEKAIKVKPDEVMAVYNAGLIYATTNKLTKGLKYLQKASKINNQIFEIEITTGKFLIRAKEFEQAKIHIKKSAELNPKASAPFKTLGDLFIARQEPEKAETEYRKAVKLNPSDAGALSGLALTYEIQNSNLDIALTFAKESIMIEPDNPLFRSRLGNIYVKQNRNDLADIEFKKAKEFQKLHKPEVM